MIFALLSANPQMKFQAHKLAHGEMVKRHENGATTDTTGDVIPEILFKEGRLGRTARVLCVRVIVSTRLEGP